MMKENLIKIYERSFIDNWELPALTDYNTGETLTYGDFARNIARLHMLFDSWFTPAKKQEKQETTLGEYLRSMGV